MSKVIVGAFTISIDGYGAGPNQSLDHPLGRGGRALHDWFEPTKTFREVHGDSGGTTGIDEAFAARGFEDVGAWILGRNMFGPIRGDWPDDDWKGWWGEDPPFHVPTFILTHYERAPVQMEGGTVFRFVTGGIGEALELARAAAGDRDVRIGGGAATIRQYLRAGLVDEMHLAISPILLGAGEKLLEGINLLELGYRVVDSQPGEAVLHVVIGRQTVVQAIDREAVARG